MEYNEAELNAMKARISSLESLVGMLLSRNESTSGIPYEELEDRVSALENESEDIRDGDTYLTSETLVRKEKKPFDIIFDNEQEDPKFYVFAPDGCVIVDGEKASFPGAGLDGYVELPDLSPDEESDASVFCHVAFSDNAWNATFDCTEESEARFTFKVKSFGATEGDGKTFTMTGSTVIITTGSVVDEISVSKNEDDEVEVNGWSTRAGEEETLAQRLDDKSSASVEVVVRDGGKSGVLKYVPIGYFSQSETSVAQPTASIVGDVMYDMSDHQLKKRVDTVNLRTGAVTEGSWNIIVGGQATPHSGEPS